MSATTPITNRSPARPSPCIWMQAGVVRRKHCESDYDCIACRFDRILGRVAEENRRLGESSKVPQGRRGSIISWKEKLKEQPPSRRPCLHHMKGRIDFRSCIHGYRCWDCDFDQFFHDQYAVYAVVTPVEMPEIKGFKMPHGYYFHRGHTWVKVEEGASVRVGMDDFALRLLGPLDRIEAPLMGKEVRQDRADISVFRELEQAKVLSPVSGVVTSVNTKLREQGRLASEDPFSEGWIMRVHSKDLRQDLKNLMLNEETREFIDEQAEQLYRLIEEVGGPLTADGGYLAHDLYGNMPELGWKRLTRLFLGN